MRLSQAVRALSACGYRLSACGYSFRGCCGADSPDYVVGGLAYQPISEIINEIVSMGFNGVRLPWSNQMWESNPTISSAYVTANPQFAGESAQTVFEQVVNDLASAGLMVVLDNHTSNAQWCCSTSDGNTLGTTRHTRSRPGFQTGNR